MNLKDADVTLGVIGCGKMSNAILSGVIKNNFFNNENIYVYDVDLQASSQMSEKLGVNIVHSIEDMLALSDIIMLATKPFVVDEIMSEIKKNYSKQLIMSILAGVKIEKYLSYIKEAQIVRIMPNTPALVNEGMSAICACDNVPSDRFEFVYEFMNNCGRVIKTTEDKMDIITALSGSGPAFYFRIIELMAESAQKLGLEFDEAMLLSAQTALGSAKMIFENNFKIGRLIKNVTTPGGCTEVGNNVLNNSNIDKILDETIEKTMQKAIELG